MVTLGTNWGRELVDQRLWLDIVCEQWRRVIAAGGRVVLDDMRFRNEYVAVREAGGALVEVQRSGYPPREDEVAASEGNLAWEDFHLSLNNSHTTEEAWREAGARRILCGLPLQYK